MIRLNYTKLAFWTFATVFCALFWRSVALLLGAM